MWKYYIERLVDFEDAADRDYLFGPTFGRHDVQDESRQEGWIISPGLEPKRAKIDFQKMGSETTIHGGIGDLIIANQTQEPAGIKLIERENGILNGHKDLFFSENRIATVYCQMAQIKFTIETLGNLTFFLDEERSFLLQDDEKKTPLTSLHTLSGLAGGVPVVLKLEGSKGKFYHTGKLKKSGELLVLNQVIGKYTLI